MASFVQTLGSASGTTSGNVLAATLTASMTAGDSVVVAIGTNGATVSSVSDSKGNTYVLEVTASNSTIGKAVIATCKAPTPLVSGDTVTVHLAVATAAVFFVVEEYVALGAVDQTGVNSGTGTSGSVVTTGATVATNEVAIAVWTTSGSITGPTATAPFTRRNTVNTQTTIQDRDLSATGTITAAFSWTTSRSYCAAIATFSFPTQTISSVPFISSNTQVFTPQLPIPLGFIASVTTVYTPQLNGQVLVPFVASVTTLYTPSLQGYVSVPFIASVTTLYTPSLQGYVAVPFISSTTAVYTPTLSHASSEVDVPFIASQTQVYPIMSLFDPNKTYGGPGNGGESFLVELNANGVTTTATLAADIGVGNTLLTMTGDSGMPTTVAFIVTVDTEQIYIFPQGGGNYRMHGRGLGNTTIATHAAGATVSWDDTYQLAIAATENIDASFTADITGSGSTLYSGWLIAFDSSQAYLSGDRYPMHVTEVLGVFDAGAGIGGTNKTDGAQPNAICTPTGVSDDCPAALANPARIDTDIVAGDVAVVAYQNPEASPLDLGSRSVSLKSWFGLERVDTSNNDVTFTDPNGIVVDTTGTYGTFTGSINGEWFEPDSIGVAPDTGLPTPNNVPYTSVTLPGSDRFFTHGSGGTGGYNDKGYPICCLAVRQGSKRVPFWQSWDWRDYSFVYAGFFTDATYAQILVNRNGIVFGSVPTVDLPGPQDIDGPDAVWDDKEYYFGASWYVAIFNTPYFVSGPGIGGALGGGGVGGEPGVAPVVTFPPGPPIVSVPPFVEGGSGGGIEPGPSGLHVWGTSGKGFA